MLYLVGIGLKPAHLTLEAVECVKKCAQVFLENYTSEYSEGHAQELMNIIGKEFKVLGRKEVEENFMSALLSARKNDIALLVFGNPLTATTHMQMLLDAKENGVKVKVIPGISVTNTIAESGLDEYKFGRTVTICYHEDGFEPESFYDQILENQKIGLHTLCLLDIKKGEKRSRFMSASEAIGVLDKISEKRKKKNKFEYVALLGMSSERQKIIYSKEKILASKEVNEVFPQCMIIIGKSNEKEKEALEKLNK